MATPKNKAIKALNMTPADIERELRHFEEKYGLPSAKFCEQFNSGELPEQDDYVLWAALCDMAYRAGLAKARRKLPAAWLAITNGWRSVIVL
jgi:hypothetical protein